MTALTDLAQQVRTPKHVSDASHTETLGHLGAMIQARHSAPSAAPPAIVTPPHGAPSAAPPSHPSTPTPTAPAHGGTENDQRIHQQCQLFYPDSATKSADDFACCIDIFSPDLLKQGFIQQRNHIVAACTQRAAEKKEFEDMKANWCLQEYHMMENDKVADCCRATVDDATIRAVMSITKGDLSLGVLPNDDKGYPMDPFSDAAAQWVKPKSSDSDELKKQKDNRKAAMDAVAHGKSKIHDACQYNTLQKAAIWTGSGLGSTYIAYGGAKATEYMIKSTKDAPGKMYRGLKQVPDVYNKLKGKLSGKGAEAVEDAEDVENPVADEVAGDALGDTAGDAALDLGGDLAADAVLGTAVEGGTAAATAGGAAAATAGGTAAATAGGGTAAAVVGGGAAEIAAPGAAAVVTGVIATGGADTAAAAGTAAVATAGAAEGSAVVGTLLTGAEAALAIPVPGVGVMIGGALGLAALGYGGYKALYD